MKQHLTTLSAVFVTAFTAFAAVPCEWITTPRTPSPAVFDRFHGESIDFRCTFTGFGALPFDGAYDVRLWYQTNGMGATWWSIPATVSSNVLAATFTPDRDPGAERLSVFFGAPSNAYAAAQVRFRNSPGATPNVLPPPDMLDWQAELAAATNAIRPTSLAPATNYTDTAIGAFAETGTVAHASTADSSGYANYAEYAGTAIDSQYAAELANREAGKARSAAQIFAQLDAATTTNDVCAIVTNEVVDGYTEWVCVPSEFDGKPFQVFENNTPDGYWMLVHGASVYAQGNADDTRLTWDYYYYGTILFTVTATRQRITHNALGIAKRSDITNIVNKAYVESLGIESGVSEATVTNVVRYIAYSINDYIWDGDVCWRRQMLQGGYLEYVAVTNIDVTLPENYKALEALEKARRNQE